MRCSFKRIFALVMTVCCVLSFSSLTALAEETASNLTIGESVESFAIEPLKTFLEMSESEYADAPLSLQKRDDYSGLDDETYACYDVLSGGSYVGYTILDTDGNIMEFSDDASSPSSKARRLSMDTPMILYAGPLASFVVDAGTSGTYSLDQEAIDLESGDRYEMSDLTDIFSDISPSSSTFVQPTPPRTGYNDIKWNHSVFTVDIQNALGIIPKMYGCGPAAGANLLYSLAKRKSAYAKILKWGADPNRNIDEVTLGSLLCTEMNAIAGTRYDEFISGIKKYMKNYGFSLTLKGQFRTDETTLGSGTTTSNLVVWNNLKTGIDGSKPVAVLTGNKTKSGSSAYPDTGSTSSMYYHWITALGYIQDKDSNMYLKVSSWGKIYYISYNALCYWRKSLGSVYINVAYK